MIVWLFLAFLSLLGLQHETEAAGNLLWKFDTKYGISSTPTWSSDVNRLYFVSKLGVLFCLDPSSGDRLWAFRTPVLEIYSLTSSPLLYTLPETSIQNNATSAVVSGTGIEGIDGHLCDGGDSSSPQNKRKKVFIGGMYSVDACTGEQLWHTQLEHTLTSTPSVLLIKRYRLFRESFNASNTNNTSDSSSNTNTDSEAAVPVLFAGSSKGELFALDAHTGQLQVSLSLSLRVCFSILLASCVMCSGALDSSGVLRSYSIIAIAPHITIILILTLKYINFILICSSERR